jgi:hypothetical protein
VFEFFTGVHHIHLICTTSLWTTSAPSNIMHHLCTSAPLHLHLHLICTTTSRPRPLLHLICTTSAPPLNYLLCTTSALLVLALLNQHLHLHFLHLHLYLDLHLHLVSICLHLHLHMICKMIGPLDHICTTSSAAPPLHLCTCTYILNLHLVTPPTPIIPPTPTPIFT